MDDGHEVIDFEEAPSLTMEGYANVGEVSRMDPFASKPQTEKQSFWGSVSQSLKLSQISEQKTETLSSSNTATTASKALLKDANGKPLFPSLYKFRMESEQRLERSSQQFASATKDWTQDVSTALRASKASMVGNLTARGQAVRTDYGVGRVVDFEKGVYEVRLSFGTLYTNTLQPKQKRKTATNLELNSAYESWEKHRTTQVKAECERMGLEFTDETMNQCVACLKEPTKYDPTLKDESGNPLFPSLYKLRQSSQDVWSGRKNVNPCLLCSAMACSQHCCKAFRKEGITVCSSCMHHLEYDLFDTTNIEDLKKQTEELKELYSRAMLLLGYCSQFMLETANSLEAKTKQHDQIGVGGSSAGLVSGVLGVAAAATILTPAGPPLLVASLVFGGSATAVQTGSEAYRYHCEPNKFANRILALQGIAETILSTIRNMRDSTVLPFFDDTLVKSQAPDEYGKIQENDSNIVDKATRAGAKMGGTMATSASLVAQEAALTGRFVSRATTAAARTARFARFAGGALSAATIAIEARELHHTMAKIKSGSPCEKAESVRTVYANLRKMPSTTYVENMCDSFVKVRSKELFRQAMATVGPCEPSEEIQEEKTEEDDLILVEDVISNLEEEEFVVVNNGASLLERVQQFKEREAKKEATASDS